MADNFSIPGIGNTTLELLEAAGFHDAKSLAKAGVDELTSELARANEILKISKRPPTRESVEKWIEHARSTTGVTTEPAAPAMMPVNHELNQQVVTMLANAPFAIPLPVRLLVEKQLGVSDVPPAILLNRYSGDLDVRVEQRITPNRQAALPMSIGGNNVKISENYIQRLDIDITRIRNTEEVGHSTVARSAKKITPENDRVTLLRAPRESTNQGRNPASRWYIRGVLHSHPGSIFFGAAATLILLVMIPLSMISAMLLLLSREYPQKFDWVPPGLLWIPCMLPVIGIIYLIWGYGGTCRICGQRLFVRRGHLKNIKAHYVRGLGYVIPLCFQILIFRWFRCSHCGTPVRLKE